MTKVKKKKALKITLITIISVILVLIIGIITVTIILYNQNFNHRFESFGNKGLYLFEEYENMEREKVTFASNKGQTLTGYYYNKTDSQDYKAVVVINHGFGGGGHRHYLPIIDRLLQENYLVFGFDKTATDESEGESVFGLPQGVIDLEYALDIIRENPRSKNLPIALMGHSWGGYSVCSILEKESDIKAVVSFSGFNAAEDMMVEYAKVNFGILGYVVQPVLKVINSINFGEYAGLSGLEGLRKTDAEVLLFHSDDDDTISIEGSFDLYQKELGDKPNLHFVRVTGMGHNVFAAIEGEHYQKAKSKETAAFKGKYNDGEIPEADWDEYMKGYDKSIANKLDEGTMKETLDFLNGVFG